jgi:hypothetical protein
MALKPSNIAFDIVFDEEQAKLGGLPVFGFAARIATTRDDYEPPDDLDFQELAELGREAIIHYLSELCGMFERGNLL